MQVGASGLPLIEQALHASDEGGTGSLNRKEFIAFYVHLLYFNELWGRFSALRASLSRGDADDVYLGFDDFVRCCESLGIHYLGVQSRRDDEGNLRSKTADQESPRSGAAVAELQANAMGEQTVMTEDEMRAAFALLSVPAGADDDDAEEGQHVGFRSFASWAARRHVGQRPLAHVVGQQQQNADEGEAAPSFVLGDGDGAEVAAVGGGDTEGGVTLICMAAIEACFNGVAKDAAKQCGFESVEAMADAARAQLGEDAGDAVAVSRKELTSIIMDNKLLTELLGLAATLNTDTHKMTVCHIPAVMTFMEKHHSASGGSESSGHVTWTDFASELEERLADAALGLRPVMSIPDSEAADKLYRQIDHNGNGGLSLDEIDTHIVLLGRVLAPNHPNFNNKPAILRAYKAADTSGDGFIGKDEFKKLLHYLVFFNNLW